jgi:hypothetical protein
MYQIPHEKKITAVIPGFNKISRNDCNDCKGKSLMNMAMHFLQHLKDEDNVGKILGFLQLKGSCNRVCKHHNMHNFSFSSKTASEDQRAANLFPTELLKVAEVEKVLETDHY